MAQRIKTLGTKPNSLSSFSRLHSRENWCFQVVLWPPYTHWTCAPDTHRHRHIQSESNYMSTDWQNFNLCSGIRIYRNKNPPSIGICTELKGNLKHRIKQVHQGIYMSALSQQTHGSSEKGHCQELWGGWVWIDFVCVWGMNPGNLTWALPSEDNCIMHLKSDKVISFNFNLSHPPPTTGERHGTQLGVWGGHITLPTWRTSLCTEILFCL